MPDLRKMSRKGQRSMVIGVAIGVLAIILVVFAVIFNFHGDSLQAYIKGEFHDTRLRMNLLNYLRTPVKVEGEDYIIADVIAMYENDPKDKYKDPLELMTKQIFNRVYGADKYHVYVEDGNFKFGKGGIKVVLDSTCTFIPATDQGKTLEVCVQSIPLPTSWYAKLFFWTGVRAATI